MYNNKIKNSFDKRLLKFLKIAKLEAIKFL